MSEVTYFSPGLGSDRAPPSFLSEGQRVRVGWLEAGPSCSQGPNPPLLIKGNEGGVAIETAEKGGGRQ